MLVAPSLSILFLLLGALGVLEEALAARLALWNGVVQLVGCGSTTGVGEAAHRMVDGGITLSG